MFRFVVNLALVLVLSPGWADSYYLCGSDEDGCTPPDYRFCFCTPQDTQHADERYCLDFTVLRCVSIENAPACKARFLFATQGDCLAVLFQSIDTPPCRLVDRSFCTAHQAMLCDQHGSLDSCHQEG